MLNNQEGLTIPNISIQVRANNEWQTLTTNDLFRNKRVIVFGLPGAFTPTCSSSHLPRYDELAPVFFANGVDDILCVSVNDTFVMNAWQQDQKLQHVKMLPDGNGALTEAVGMLVDKSDLGFGKRSWRYAMVVNDGVIEKMFIEPEKPGDPFEVSDADTMLNYICPQAQEPAYYTLFTKAGCPHCARAKAMLNERDLAYEEIIVQQAVSQRGFKAVTGENTVPQVFLKGQHIGGADQLAEFLADA
ncbi:glutathione peroxidase [Zooshikella ganghwensis]|uniref:glutathione peroxidase n=1 Tax=Zooshikella ganghwensis TaxID=202772 RepID=UPI0003F6CADE|nr:glutathione peroxidase [Zooshikella ganghwensis]